MENIAVVVGMIEAECREKLEAAETAEDKLRVAFRGAKNHWMFTSEGEQQRGAIGAAMHHMDQSDRDIVAVELKVFNALNASMTGIPVNFEALEIPEKVIGIMKIYQEVQAE